MTTVRAAVATYHAAANSNDKSGVDIIEHDDCGFDKSRLIHSLSLSLAGKYEVLDSTTVNPDMV